MAVKHHRTKYHIATVDLGTGAVKKVEFVAAATEEVLLATAEMVAEGSTVEKGQVAEELLAAAILAMATAGLAALEVAVTPGVGALVEVRWA